MAITVSGTSITFNDSTTQSTAATGTVTSVATGNGLTGGTITTTGTISLDYYTGSSSTNSSYPVGSYLAIFTGGGTAVNLNATTGVYYTNSGGNTLWTTGASGGGARSAVSGTWRCRGSLVDQGCAGNNGMLVQRTA